MQNKATAKLCQGIIKKKSVEWLQGDTTTVSTEFFSQIW